MAESKQKVHLDFESRSVLKFGQAGGVSVNQYARHWGTDIWLLRYSIGDGAVKAWDPWHGEPLPQDLVEAIEEGLIVCAHNATFEWLLWNHIMVPRYGAPELPFEQMDDTAVRAAIMALPRSLEEACKAMGVPVEKDMDGKRLMMRMAKPRKIHDYHADGKHSIEEWADFEMAAAGEPMRYTVHPTVRVVYEWWADTDRFARLGAYCDVDVEAERALDHVLIEIPAINRRDLMLTHKTNMRGVHVDVDLAERAKAIMNCAETRYADELKELTQDQVNAPTKVGPMREWMEQFGVSTPSLDKAHVSALLESPEFQDPEFPPRRVLEIRQAAGKSSVAKLVRFMELTNEQGVMFENFLYHGAGTGRLSGKGAQLQNLPSRTGLDWHRAEMAVAVIHQYANDPEGALMLLELLYGDVPEVISSTLRAHLKAAPGKQLYVADFSNIEGRVAAWLAGETKKIEAFNAFDAGTGPDIYKATAGEILGISAWDVDKTQRNVLGKVPELALGFEGGVGAFQSMAKIYRVNMAEYWPTIQRALDAKYVNKARENWERFGSKSGIEIEEWLASETVKLAWRAKHPAIARCWKDCYEHAVKALQQPGKWQKFAGGKLAFGAKEIGGVNFLIGRLPSGRTIFKAHAKLKTVSKFGRPAQQISYMGVDSVTRRWMPMSTYSGDLFQSFVQAAAFDMMMHGWAAVEEHDYDVVLSVHDELGAESYPDRSVEEFERLMSTMPVWADGCPVVAAGYVADRYRKD